MTVPKGYTYTNERRTEAYQGVVNKLYAKPGQWYRAGIYGTKASASMVGYCIRNGKQLKAFQGKAGQFETRVRNDVEVWVKYVGKTTATRKRGKNAR